MAVGLAVPDSAPEKGGIIIAAFAVVAFSSVVQSLTMPWLLKRLCLTRKVEPIQVDAKAPRAAA
jgi:CPA1 family monovalent cation:H+ antiporter